jgi:hypothetical protein
VASQVEGVPSQSVQMKAGRSLLIRAYLKLASLPPNRQPAVPLGAGGLRAARRTQLRARRTTRRARKPCSVSGRGPRLQLSNKCFRAGRTTLIRPRRSLREVMAQRAKNSKESVELSQLFELHDRLMRDLQQVRDELVAPGTRKLVRQFHETTGSSPEGMGPVTAAVEEAIRTIKLSESSLRTEMTLNRPKATIDGIDNMPAALARFIAERTDNPGFRYNVIHDENRGWIVQWKEYWDGNVRGSGQFYERPYAWLDD